VDICTIIAKNYVAQARVLARSFAQHHPGGRCYVLVIDDYEGYIDPRREPFTSLTPAEIGCDEFEEMAVRYDVLEVSTAVKPWLLAHLLSGERDVITYLDPDIRIYGSLQQLDDLAHEHRVVLTPHNTTPVPDDGERPGQVDILLAGVYNLGYLSLGCGEETDNLLRWWRERLLTDCRVDPQNGYFVDQRWFDLAPGLMPDHTIVRASQYNLAYWNVFGRHLEHDESRYMVDGLPLAFFHFSGFDPEEPDTLSRHQTRVRLSENRALERICHEYANEVLGAGYGEAKAWPYTYGWLPCGVEFDPRLRRMYADGVDAGELAETPFTDAGSDTFLKWLSAPAPGGPPKLSRMLASVYESRPDLQAAFTDVRAGEPKGLLGWVRQAGVIEEPVLGLIEPVSLEAGESDRSEAVSSEAADQPEAWRGTRAWGVNVVGYFRSEVGTGEAARQAVSALDACGIPVLPVHGRMVPGNRQGHAFTYLDYTDARYPVNLICMNADMLGEFAGQAGDEFFQSRYSIGMWFWEVEQFPERWMSAFDHLDELWLPTDHIVRAIGAVSPIPVLKMTLPVEMPPLLPASRASLNLPEGFMFLFSFDHHSVFERKNPLGVIEAYRKAFDPDNGTVLVIKSINAEDALGDHERLMQAASGRPDIHVMDGYLSPHVKNQMMAACDAYVSLHRGEGFGLTMAEAMYQYKPVVATGYSGNLDFMTERNSYLVDHRLVRIGGNAAPYPPGGRWAEPDLDHAARLMAQVFEDREESDRVGRLAGEEIRRTHSAAAAGEGMYRRLELLREREARRFVEIGRASATEEMQRQIDAGPRPNPAHRLARVRGLARRFILRLMKPYTAHQRIINAEVADALRLLEGSLRELEDLRGENRAARLQGLRSAAAERYLIEHVGYLTRGFTELEASTGDLPRRTERVESSVRQITAEDHAIPYMEDPPFRDISDPLLGLVQGYASSATGREAEPYRSFEDTFRGSEAMIRNRQRLFLDLLEGREPVLDFGCGRGEFLDLLAERGVSFLAVDSDPGMVRRCHEKGHADVKLADGMTYLESLQDGSLGAIFCAQVIEHLPYDSLVRFLALSRSKLGSDGVLLVETVNPHCPQALKTFWVDPTHEHPIFPEVALHLCRSAGFATALMFHPNGTRDVTVDRFSQGEYAIIAGGEQLWGAACQETDSRTHRLRGPQPGARTSTEQSGRRATRRR
jgi:glycosyltransferase involved in cell wall biosynthesis/SAM-dependent methyltransferase